MPYVIQDQTLTDIADAIREKTGKTDAMTPLQMPDEILSIQGGDSEWDAEPPYDGNMRLYLDILSELFEMSDEAKTVIIKFSTLTAYNSTIDWGDGSEPQKLSASNTHTYASAGKYIVTIIPDPDEFENVKIGIDGYDGSSGMFGNRSKNVLLEYLIAIYYNDACARGSDRANYGTAVYGATRCRKIGFPQNITNFRNNSGFGGLRSLYTISLPETLTTIAYYACAYSYLYTLTIPPLVTSMSKESLQSSNNLQHLYMKPLTPPALAGTFAFFPSTCIIHVPTGTLEAYQTATNWANYADQMQEWEVPEE